MEQVVGGSADTGRLPATEAQPVCDPVHKAVEMATLDECVRMAAELERAVFLDSVRREPIYFRLLREKREQEARSSR